jgi:hypothetical protein
VVGKGEVGKGGRQVVWLEGRMGEVLDLGWEGLWGWHLCLLFFSHSFIWGSHIYIVSVLLGIPTF